VATTLLVAGVRADSPFRIIPLVLLHSIRISWIYWAARSVRQKNDD